MKPFSTLLLLLFFCFQFAEAQEIRAQVVDAATKQPIPYANILLGENRGVITNEEGFFSYNSGEKPYDLIKISSMGYELLEIDPNDIRNELVFLVPASFELKEVFLSNRNLTAKEILKKVKEEINNNYDFNLSEKRVFLRESSGNYIKRFDLKVDKSTIAGIDQNLMNQITNQIPKVSDSYKEVLADLYGNYDSQKLRIIKAANLGNPGINEFITELNERVEYLLKDIMKPNSYLKIRSGIVGIKMDAEELEEELFAEVAESKREKTPEEKTEEHAKSLKNLQSISSGRINSLMNNMFWKGNNVFNVFDKSGKYTFKTEGYALLNNATVYVISFTPKRGADFKGRMYVNTIDYGVHRLEYENVKPLKNFRLLGVRRADDVYRGKMIFIKNANNKYVPSYIERETGESFGIERPLTIIEKNKTVKGPRKQNELDLDFKLQVSNLEKLQLVVYENAPLEKSAFDSLQKPGDFEYKNFKVYNPDFWNGNNVMEPNEAIKNFTALEQ